MNQRCVIYYEKRLNGNRATLEINTEAGEESLQRGARILNKELLLSPLPLSFSFSALLLSLAFLVKSSTCFGVTIGVYIKKSHQI